jgi:hypothetical protein
MPAPPDLSRAVVLYIRWKSSSYPWEDEQAVIDEFGEEAGRELSNVARALLDTEEVISPLESGTMKTDDLLDLIMERVRIRVPDLSDEALAAIRWYFSYQYK